MNFLSDLFNKIHPEKFFLLTALIFGTIILFITPPFQVPDEPNHFYRCWQISEGGFQSIKQDKRVGGYLPVSVEKVTQPFFKMIWSKETKLQDMGMHDLLKVPLNPTERKFYDFNNTAMYSPICYLPGAAGIFTTRSFGASPLYGFYAARLMTLFTWILLIYFCIKRLPVYKWLFTFLALLPMSLFINMSISADVITNAVCFLLITQIITYACDPYPFDNKRLRNVFISAILLGSVKSIYAPLILIIFILPKNKFKSNKDWWIKMSFLFFSAVIFSTLWNSILNPLYLSYDDYNPDFRDGAALVNGANIPRQIDYILHHGSYLVNVLGRSVVASFDMYFPGYIGTFGWLDSPLPLWLIYLVYPVLFLIAVLEGSKNNFINLKQKSIVFICFLSIAFLLFLSQHLVWDLVGGELILNIQGRYLIALMPLLFILFYNRKVCAPKLVQSLTLFSILTLLLFSLKVLYLRYH